MSDLKANIRALRGPILVTGASGFVGANLFKMLTAVRDDVYAVVLHQKNWRLAEISDECIFAVDLNDYAAVKSLINTVKPQTVFDCSAYGAYSFEEDANLIYQTNFQSIVNFVEQLVAQPFAAFIHAGSSSEYGSNCSAPSEDSRCEPNSHYAVSKVAVASYLRFMGKQRSFPCVNLRLYSVYGPLEDTSRLLPNLLRQALAGNLPPLVDPRTSRDFIHVDDVCAAFIMAAVKMHPSLYGENFNIGTGIKTTIAELVDVTRCLFNVTAEPKFGTMEGRAWDLAEWYSDPRKAIEQIGWKPLVKLEDGLRSMALWVARLTDTELIAASKKNINQ